MRVISLGLILFFNFLKSAVGYANVTVDPAERQLPDFKKEHPTPIGVLTTGDGSPVDVRDLNEINSDLLASEYFLDSTSHQDSERIPERVVHAKGAGAFGYFEVTNDVSKYIAADVFNGVHKKTPVAARFSLVVQNTGGNDLARETRGAAFKFYTKDGNLDLIGLHIPVYFYRNPASFMPFAHSFKRNPQTNLLDPTARWDFTTLRPQALHALLWLFSDYGLPDGYRKIDSFPIHTYEVYNKHGERYYVRFNFRTEQGLANFTSLQGLAIGAVDPDYANRDLYNAIKSGNYPSWRLEMDIIPIHDLKKLDYNPFDVTRLWKNGTYFTVTIGRVVLNRNPGNVFRDVEMSEYNPSNLVPGIPGPVDNMFKSRRFAYRDAQSYRLGINRNKIEVNLPKNIDVKTYDRDGVPPVRDNMHNAPNYYPNSFHGPIPNVEIKRPKEKLVVFESNAVDLEPASYFYNHVVGDDAHKQRLADNAAQSLLTVEPLVQKRALELLFLTDHDLGARVKASLKVATPPSIAECLARSN